MGLWQQRSFSEIIFDSALVKEIDKFDLPMIIKRDSSLKVAG